jgi:hypothetical protein
MNFRDSNGESSNGKYISKRVMINGQYVTLYSVNGQTWLSSPEDIPALMDRLDNARITLNTGEKVAEGEPTAAPAKSEPVEEEKAAPQKVLQTKYRMKGPKPRPILRQGGIVIRGTPIEPVSASNATMSFSSDNEHQAENDAKVRALKSGSKGKAPKRDDVQSKSTKDKPSSAHKKLVAPVLQKPITAKQAKKEKLEAAAKEKAAAALKSAKKPTMPAATPKTLKATKDTKGAAVKTGASKNVPVKKKAVVAAVSKKAVIKKAAVKKASKKAKATKKK